MLFFIDSLIFITALLMITKAGELILRPHQRRAFDDAFDTLTIKIDDTKPMLWFLSLHHRKYWHIYLAIGLISPITFSIWLSQYTPKPGTEVLEYTDHEKFLLVVVGWLTSMIFINGILLLLRFLTRKSAFILFTAFFVVFGRWYIGIMQSYSISLGSIIKYLTTGSVYAFPNPNGTEPYWIWEPGAFSGFHSYHLLLYSILGEVVFFATILVQIFLVILALSLLTGVVDIVVRFIRALLWRISEFSNGPFMGLMVLFGAMLGLARVLVS